MKPDCLGVWVKASLLIRYVTWIKCCLYINYITQQRRIITEPLSKIKWLNMLTCLKHFIVLNAVPGRWCSLNGYCGILFMVIEQIWITLVYDFAFKYALGMPLGSSEYVLKAVTYATLFLWSGILIRDWGRKSMVRR